MRRSPRDAAPILAAVRGRWPSMLLRYWLAPDGVSLAAVAGKLTAAGADALDVLLAEPLVPASPLLRLQPAVKQMHADSAAIDALLNVKLRIMMRSLSGRLCADFRIMRRLRDSCRS